MEWRSFVKILHFSSKFTFLVIHNSISICLFLTYNKFTKWKEVETRVVGQLGQSWAAWGDWTRREWSLASQSTSFAQLASLCWSPNKVASQPCVKLCNKWNKWKGSGLLLTIHPAAGPLSKQTQNKLTWAKSGQLSSSEEVWRKKKEKLQTAL